MVSTRRRRQQNRRHLSQLGEFDGHFTLVQNNHNILVESKASLTGKNVAFNNTNHSVLANGSQVDIRTFERSITNKVLNEVDNVVATVETRVHDAILSAMEGLVLPRVELAMKSVNESSGLDSESVVLDPDLRNFSGNIESLQMAASSRMHSITDLNKIDETRGNITVEASELSVNEKNFDQQAHTHHSFVTESLQFN